ncbi:hypothetical protein [Paraflavitalea sp. CAU 1676]|uniref:hypothetical protein n=1 Tax=Paraflavitalea sp. CAU 1676 TaxID=3032598 RepID=UPI0023DB7AA2|nr:hypothetical protein [Paraflavitalea sp. CAU 1676]MDF2188244.1 hypothetical protein [Paraflavitalea sp. CAU 1676]
MTPRSEKYKYLYWPFVIILFTCIGGYSLLHWLWVSVFAWSDPHIQLSHWVLPIILVWTVSSLYFIKRVNLLEGPKKYRNDRSGYLAVIGILVVGPMVSSQYLLMDIAGQRKQLNDPSEVLSQQGARYYTIKDHKADRYNTYRREFITYSGGRRTSTKNTLVIVLPVYATKDFPLQSLQKDAWQIDTASREFQTGNLYAKNESAGNVKKPQPGTVSAIWLCFMYDTSISRDISEFRRKAAMERFIQHSIEDFQRHDPDNFSYLVRPANNDDRLQLEVTVREAFRDYEQTPFVVMPVFEPYHNRYSTSMGYFVIFTAAALILWLLQLATVKVDKKGWQQYVANRRRAPLRGATTYS